MEARAEDKKPKNRMTVVFVCSPRHWSLDQTKLILRANYYRRVLLILKPTVAVENRIVKSKHQDTVSGVPK